MTDFNEKVIFNSFVKGRFNYWLHERGLRASLHDETEVTI